MKRIFTYLILAVIAIACETPGPTELSTDIDNSEATDSYTVEVLSPNPSEEEYEVGYDSTGVFHPVPKATSTIYVTGIKNTLQNKTTYISRKTAEFIDKTQPVHSHGKTLGHKSLDLGEVSFDGEIAIEKPKRIKYRFHGEPRDTVLGVIHELIRKGNSSSTSGHRFGRKIEFSLVERGHGSGNGNGQGSGREKIEFEIPVPDEITCEVSVSGTISKGNLKTKIFWNGDNKGKIDIVIGGLPNNSRDPFPLMRFTTKNDGEFTIPQKLLRSIPFDRFGKMIVSVIRRIEFSKQINMLRDNKIVSQSIHNVEVDVR